MSDHPQAFDEATRAAIAALTHRTRERDTTPAEERGEAEVFAVEFLIALRGQGWRLTAARPAEPWQHAGPTPAPDVYPRGAQLARAVLHGTEPEDPT